MSKEKIKVYLYTRVSTNMQIDGYSLDAQKTKMKAFCDYNEYEIAGEYEDDGKSGKSIEGRVSFNQMMEASDEEFDTEEVRKLVKRLDELDPIPLPWKSDEVDNKNYIQLRNNVLV